MRPISYLRRVLNNKQLGVRTKMQLHRALVMSMLLHGPETGTMTLLVANLKRLDGLHMRWERQLLIFHWPGYINRATVCEKTQLTIYINDGCPCLVTQLVWKNHHHQSCSVRLQTNLFDDRRRFDARWKRLFGCWRQTWLTHIKEDADMSSSQLWLRDVLRGHSGATQRSAMSSLTTIRDNNDDEVLKVILTVQSLFENGKSYAMVTA